MYDNIYLYPTFLCSSQLLINLLHLSMTQKLACEFAPIIIVEHAYIRPPPNELHSPPPPHTHFAYQSCFTFVFVLMGLAFLLNPWEYEDNNYPLIQYSQI